MKGLGALCILVLVSGCFSEEVRLGELVVDKSIYEQLSTGKSSGKTRVARTAARSRETDLYIWEYMFDGQYYLVPYTVDGVSDQSVLDNIDEAINTFNGLDLCVKFRRIDNLNEENAANAINLQYHVNFMDQEGCYTYLAVRLDGVNIISIDPADSDCNNVATIYRYIMHTLGFFPEHMRPDRDQYIKVFRRNVIKGYRHMFDSLQDWVVDTYNLPYDFESITHFPAKKFSKNGASTIKMRDGSSFDYVNEELSALDKMAIKILYSCPGACYDKDQECAIRKKFYFCVNHPSLMKDECPLTCGFCECEDEEGFCDALSEEDCYVESEIGTMQQRCPLKCGYCSHGCHDYDENECRVLEQRGDCDTNRSHMAQVCPRTCDLCINSNQASLV